MLVGVCALPGSVARGGDAAGPTLLAAGGGYWVLVGVVALALVTAEWHVRRNGAWLAIAGLGAGGVVAAAALAVVGSAPLVVAAAGADGAVSVATRPGAGLWALALGSVAVAAGGLLLRPPDRGEHDDRTSTTAEPE